MKNDVRYEEGRSRWPTTIQAWKNVIRPSVCSFRGLADRLSDYRVHGTTTIPSHVDPWKIGPIIAKIYSENHKDHEISRAILRFSKASLDEMSFMCGMFTNKNKDYFSGLITYKPDDSVLQLDHLDSSTWDIPVHGTEGMLCENVVQVAREAEINELKLGKLGGKHDRLYPANRSIFENSGLRIH